MDNLLSNFMPASPHAPARGPKSIPNDPTPPDQAIYFLSLTPGYATDIHRGNWDRALPDGIVDADLNFLDPANALFRAPHVMSSAGQALRDKNKGIVTERNVQNTCLMTDSAGFQVANQTGNINDLRDRAEILDWIEARADISMTLDIPTGRVGKEDYPFKTSQHCLDRTLDHLNFFAQRHTPGKVTWLNVIQGNTHLAGYSWYEAVKHFDCFEGWAIGGPMRKSFTYVLSLLLRMLEDGNLQNKKWIHVLGTNELWIAVLLTAVQRALNRNGCNLRISFDTSTPCTLIRTNDVCGMPRFNAENLMLPNHKAPDGKPNFRSNTQWPWPSAIGNKLTLGDICVPSPRKSPYCRDKLSYTLMMLHNYAALREAVLLANRVMDAQKVGGDYVVAPRLARAITVIDKIFDGGGRKALYQNSTLFNDLGRNTLSEDERGAD